MLATDAAARTIVALDCAEDEALALARGLRGHADWLKVGMTLYYAAGPKIVRQVSEMGYKVFLDLKLHDIPHQVRGAARSAALAGADLLSIHACGGSAMVAAAREGVEAAAGLTGSRCRLVAITVLTSMDAAALAEVGVGRPIPEQVASLASMAAGAGADGVVCSPREAAQMRSLLGPGALVVTPGVRPAGSEAGDQSRTATPAAAFAAGASHIVVGRPITRAADAVAAFDAITASCEAGS